MLISKLLKSTYNPFQVHWQHPKYLLVLVI